MVNPYFTNTPAIGPQFRNRTILLDEMSRYVSQSSPISCLIIGDRGAGKTSVLKALGNRLGQEHLRFMSPRVLPILVELEVVSPKNETEFYIACLRSLEDVLASEGSKVELVASFGREKSNFPVRNFVKTLELVDGVTDQSRRIAILVDDFDFVMGWDLQALMDFLRRLKSGLLQASTPIALILTSIPSLYMVLENEGSPMFLAMHRRVLESFDKEGTEELMTAPVKGSELEHFLSASRRQEIWNLTGGNPILVQLFMRVIYELVIERARKQPKELACHADEDQFGELIKRETVTENDVKFSEDSAGELFQDWYDRMEEPIRRVYHQIACCGMDHGVSRMEIESHNPSAFASKSLERYLEALRGRGVIRKIRIPNSPDSHYVATGEAFRTWFLNRWYTSSG